MQITSHATKEGHADLRSMTFAVVTTFVGRLMGGLVVSLGMAAIAMMLVNHEMPLGRSMVRIAVIALNSDATWADVDVLSPGLNRGQGKCGGTHEHGSKNGLGHDETP